jgi:hypothetical protein
MCASSVFTERDQHLDAAAGKPLSAVIFDPSSHAYCFHGRRLISVTQAIRAAGLIRSEWHTEAVRQRGRAVHLALHFDAEGISTTSSCVAPHSLQGSNCQMRSRTGAGMVPHWLTSFYRAYIK